MFLLKKLAAPFLYPVALCLEIMVVGLIFLWFTRRQRAGKVILTFGVVLLALLSHEKVADSLLGPLEWRYPPLREPAARTTGRIGRSAAVGWVLVLGGGHAPDFRLPPASRLSPETLVRLIEGIQIHRAHPGSKLILSGGSSFGPVSGARMMADLAVALRVNEEDIVLEERSRDTGEQAAFVREILGRDRFILVTSASHMPRSMALFGAGGMRPIPAPVGHRVKEKPYSAPKDYFPSYRGLLKSRRAIHETLGLLWARIRGRAE